MQMHPLAQAFSHGEDDQSGSKGHCEGPEGSSSSSSPGRTTLSRFLPTSRRLVQFSNGRQPPEGGRIVYIDGAFDVFHPGHVKMLAAAKAQGDFLLVGIHGDQEVHARV